MTRQEAIQHVANHLVGYLNGMTADEVHETDDSRNEDKIEAAMSEVTRRLLKMGAPHHGACD